MIRGEIMKNIVLKNKYKVVSMPKTTAQIFKDLKVGDVIEISLLLTSRRGGDNNSLYALYPLINGVACSGIPTINKLIDKGMVLEEVGELDER